MSPRTNTLAKSPMPGEKNENGPSAMILNSERKEFDYLNSIDLTI